MNQLITSKKIQEVQILGRQSNIVQYNEYQTDPYFIQLSQNMEANCLFTFVFFPVLT